MARGITIIVELLAAVALLWLRRTRIQKPVLRLGALIAALILAYPAVNELYIGIKHFIVGWRST